MGDPDIILSAAYAEEELLDQPFLIPDGTVINYDLTRGDYHPTPQFSVSVYSGSDPSAQDPSPAPYWENCTATLEEVQSAVFTGPVPVMELQTAEVMKNSQGDQEVTSSDSGVKKKSSRKPKKKSTYKHIPHREKPAHLVEKRNARERRRVEAVNGALFS